MKANHNEGLELPELVQVVLNISKSKNESKSQLKVRPHGFG
ncbi:hypothetical protein [Parapedobacter sp. 2B3]